MVNDNGSVVALGNFDGLHKGHRKVISTAVEKAGQMGLKAVVLLFKEHPCYSLGYNMPPRLMTKSEQKQKIQQMGAECVEIEFHSIMNMDCQQFVRDILIEKLGARALCCGFNYHFGKGGKGTADALNEIAENMGLELYVTDALCYKENVISSSRIRECIAKGNMTDANTMLGESFGYEFEVVGGDRIGRNLGAPTINQYFEDGFILPLNGVYTSTTYINGKSFCSITNIGIRPTVNKKDGECPSPRSETYIIGFSGDLYGRKIRVELRKYIRSEKKFSSLDELKQQIQTDCEIAKDEVIMKKFNVKAIFFDFDDTLQSRQSAYRLYCETFIDKYFSDVEENDREKMLNEMEECADGGYKDREEYFSELISLWDWDEHPPVQELCDSFDNDYGKNVVMLPYALDVLEEIKQRGYTVGIISNDASVLQNIKLDTAGIRDMFDVVITSDDIGVCKPDRKIFDEACCQSGYNNEECLFVGNHPVNDIQGASSAGMKVVRMNQGDFYNKELDSNFPVIEDLRELLDLI